jgi:predicted O-methyltransferase YrrM
MISNHAEKFDLIANIKPKDLKSLTGSVASNIIREAAEEFCLISEEELSVIGTIVEAIRPVRTLEVGLASGSTAMTIMACKPPDPDAIHIALDPFQKEVLGDTAIEKITRAGQIDHFKLIREFSYMAMPELLKEGAGTFDFIYIDASHKFDETLIEWFYADRLLRSGGWIGFDDCDWPMVRTVLNFVQTNCAYKVVRATERTWFALKLHDDKRHWFDFNPFEVAWDDRSAEMIETARSVTAARRRSELQAIATQLITRAEGFGTIAIYGAGAIGEAVVELARERNLPCTCLVDRDASLWGSQIAGLTVVSLQDAVAAGNTSFLIASRAFLEEITETLVAAVGPALRIASLTTPHTAPAGPADAS